MNLEKIQATRLSTSNVLGYAIKTGGMNYEFNVPVKIFCQ